MKTPNQLLAEEYERERQERLIERQARKERDINRRKLRNNRHLWTTLEGKDTE